MITIKFLGSGSAFVNAYENYQSNIIIEQSYDNKQHRLLYDCGTTIKSALLDANLNSLDIDAVYISHLHADHSGGIEYLAFSTYFQPPELKKKPFLYAHKKIIKNGWNKSWRGGLEYINGKKVNLSNYFNKISHSSIKGKNSFTIYDIIFQPIQTKHIKDNEKYLPSYGLSFDINNKHVFISGDTTILDNDIYEQYDLIFHDCEFAEYPNSVHTQFHELNKLDDNIKNKMWLYHYDLKSIDKSDAIIKYHKLDKSIKLAGFCGLVKRGQEFKF